MSLTNNEVGKKYFKIINADRSTFTYGREIEDPGLLRLLEFSFVDRELLNKYVKADNLIADVIVNKQSIKRGMFNQIDEEILYTDEIELVNFRESGSPKPSIDLPLVELEEPVHELKDSVHELKVTTYEFKNLALYEPNVDQKEQFQNILNALNSQHTAFFANNVGQRLYAEFNPEAYLRNEIINLQKQLSECLKKKDDKADVIAIEYTDKSVNFDHNIQVAHLKIHKLLKNFNETTFFVSKMIISICNLLEFEEPISNDEKYQLYLNSLAFFAGNVIDHPLF